MEPMATDGGMGQASRKIKLGEVTVSRRNYKLPNLIIPYNRYWGKTTVKGSEIIGWAGMGQNEGARPVALFLADSERVPGDMIGVPTSEISEDNLKITWVDGGKIAQVEVGKLLAFRKIKVPAGTRMFINLYQEEDSTFGKVVGMRINAAEFEPIRTRKDDGETDSSGEQAGK